VQGPVQAQQLLAQEPQQLALQLEPESLLGLQPAELQRLQEFALQWSRQLSSAACYQTLLKIDLQLE
jgi:hypothetical protein